METELTRKIKRGLTHFRLDMPTSMRTPRYAEEVTTPTGVVDFVRFEDVKTNCKTKCKLMHYDEFDPAVAASISPRFSLGECKLAGYCFPNAHCAKCVFRHDEYDIGRRMTCFEVKISKEDFHSEHGHNFHGHRNYYVMPAPLAKELKHEIPVHIGMIAYYEESDSYRVIKECQEIAVTPEAEAHIMYNAFRKWVDKFHYEYWNPVYKTSWCGHHLDEKSEGETLW